MHGADNWKYKHTIPNLHRANNKKTCLYISKLLWSYTQNIMKNMYMLAYLLDFKVCQLAPTISNPCTFKLVVEYQPYLLWEAINIGPKYLKPENCKVKHVFEKGHPTNGSLQKHFVELYSLMFCVWKWYRYWCWPNEITQWVVDFCVWN